MEFLNFVISSLCTDERRSFVYLFQVVPAAAEIYPDASRLTLCSFFGRILNNRYRISELFLYFLQSRVGDCSDILCKNHYFARDV